MHSHLVSYAELLLFLNLLDSANLQQFVHRSSVSFCYLIWTGLRSVVRMSSGHQYNFQGIQVLKSCSVSLLQPSGFGRTLKHLESREFDTNQPPVVVGEEVTPELPICSKLCLWC